MSLPLPVVCESSLECCEGSRPFYGQGRTYLNAQVGFLLTCPPGFSCDAGFYPHPIVVPTGTVPFTPPTGQNPLRFTCCDGSIEVRYLPDGFTQAQFEAAAQSIVDAAAVKLAGCMATQYNQQHATPAKKCTITTAALLPQGDIGVPYSASLSQTGATLPVTWSLLSGALPPGLALSSGGVISGTPTGSAASYGFVVRLSNTAGTSCTKLFTLTINDLSPAAWWKFDGSDTAPDDEVAGYTLAFDFNAPGTPGVSGHIADAFQFAATNNQTCHYTTGPLAPLAYTGAGLECLFWLKFNAIAAPDPLGICDFRFTLDFVVGADLYAIRLLYDAVNSPNQLILNLRLNGVQTAVVAVAHVPALGTWRFIRLRFDAATGKLGLAVDNSALSESGAAALPASASTQLEVASAASFFQTMSVSLDELGIFELGIFLSALTDANATAIYNGGIGETCCPLAAP